MIHPVSDIQAMSFMSLFPEMKEDEHWQELVQWVGSGKSIPVLNLGVFDGKMVGVFPCETYTDGIMIHACFLKGYRGEFARDAAKEAFSWIWNNTKYDKIQAYIEPDHVKKYAAECGMKEINGLFEVSKCQK